MEQNRSTDVWLEVVGGSAEAAHSVSAASLFLRLVTAVGFSLVVSRPLRAAISGPKEVPSIPLTLHIGVQAEHLGGLFIKDERKRNCEIAQLARS